MTGDLALRLWREGYRALQEARAGAGGGDVFAGRLLGRRAVVVRGHEGAKLFYDTTVVERRHAVPAALADLLFGRGAVHGLDGTTHRARKQLFLDLLAEDQIAGVADQVAAELRARSERWRGREVVLFDELTKAYAAAILDWVGAECSPAEAARLGHRMAAIVDGFGFAPVAYPRAWVERLRGNAWGRQLLRRARERPAGATSPTGTLAEELGPAAGAVELLNIVRPTVAVAWPGTFAALALAEHPQWRDLLRGERRDGVAERRVAFGHEVRRYYPFVPALAGRARRGVEIGGVPLRPGDRLVLDVVGTNHDPALWDEPEVFRPERFAGVQPDPYDFVPQGGGDPRTGHRCPGEPLTVRLLAATLGVLAEVDYEVVSSGSYDGSRIPTRPAGGLVVAVR